MENKSATNQYIYQTRGVCPPEIHFKINGGKLSDLRFVGGGCPGNAQLVSRLLEDKPLPEVLSYSYSQNCEQADMPKMDARARDWLFQLPQVVSFKLNSRKSMAFYGDYIQSFADYSDFEPFALEMNMVSGLTNFMQNETVFPALEAMIPQFQADIIVFSQTKTWGTWHIGGKDFISVGAAAAESGVTWGLLESNNGRADLKIMKVEH